MSGNDSPAVRLVADVGGTNTRLALYAPADREFRALSTYVNREFPRLEDILARWLGTLAEPAPTVCCIAVAAPPSGDHVAMSNIDWSFSCSELAKQFGFRQMLRLNDFEANAYALPHLTSRDWQQLYAGRGVPAGQLATVGPGTGLGGAFLAWQGGCLQSFACEPGHSGLAPGNELELDIFRLLLPRHGNIYAELLVSGPGLVRLHGALAEVSGKLSAGGKQGQGDHLGPAEITRLALAGEDDLCVLALETFCALLGSACGDFLLTTGSYGGLYLAGGIVPRLTTFIGKSAFHKRLTEKGAMRDALARVPIYAITTSHPGLIGAAHAPLH